MSEICALDRGSHRTHRPLDTIERMAEENDWTFDRDSDDEVTVQVSGSWCDYHMLFVWNDVTEAIFFTCTFDIRIPIEKIKQAYELITMLDKEMWIGHFCIWKEEGIPIFRHTLPLRDTTGPSHGQVEDVVEAAIIECDRFYPAFQHVIWNGKSAEDAIKLAMIDCVGNA